MLLANSPDRSIFNPKKGLIMNTDAFIADRAYRTHVADLLEEDYVPPDIGEVNSVLDAQPRDILRAVGIVADLEGIKLALWDLDAINAYRERFDYTPVFLPFHCQLFGCPDSL